MQFKVMPHADDRPPSRFVIGNDTGSLFLLSSINDFPVLVVGKGYLVGREGEVFAKHPAGYTPILSGLHIDITA